jgi:pimeloyl-ACP methyl ester carboxylesterase
MDYARDGESAFALLERDCRADSVCVRAFPDVRADLESVLASAQAGKFLAKAPTGEMLPMSRDAIAGTILGAMQSAGTRSRVPLLLHLAATGRSEPLVGLVMQYRQQLDQAIAMGMHLSVSCADDGHHIDTTAARATDARTFLGSSRVRMLAEACAAWATMRETPDAHAPVRSMAPVLLVSGELDPNTPPRWGAEALRTLPNAAHVVLRGVAHGWSNVEACGADFVAAFVAQASVANLDVRCASVPSAPPFATAVPNR